MTVTSSNFTLVFRVGTENSHANLTAISITGSVPILGMWLLDSAPRMDFDSDILQWSYSMHLNHPPAVIEYCFVWTNSAGDTYEDIKRRFIVPDNVRRLLSASSKEVKVLVEIVSVIEQSESTVSIYTPGVSMKVSSPRMSPDLFRKLTNLKSVLSDLRQENSVVRGEMMNMSSHFFDSLKPQKDNTESTHQLVKQLLTEINELKGKVKVVCRIRPLLTGEPDEFYTDVSSGSISILDACAYRDFEFDQVMASEVDNEQLYKQANLGNLIQTSVLIGNNVCIFAYGQTGSGKSHTMLGSARDPLGLVQLTIDSVFHTLANRTATSTLSVELLEIYRETVFPLVPEQSVFSADQALQLFKNGVALRATAATRLNATSSRSHCIFRFIVNNSCIYLVDLAGSERTKLSGASGDRLAEANAINKSLSALGLVLNGLLNKRTFIPYRDSKLTKLLAHVFTKTTPPSKVVMIANISPALSDIRESVSTLQFAQRVCEIELKGTTNQVDEELINQKMELIDQLLIATKNR